MIVVMSLIADPGFASSNTSSAQLSHITSMEIDHEIFCTVIIPFPLSTFKKGNLSVTGENICTSTGLLLRGLILPRKGLSRLTDQLNMT